MDHADHMRESVDIAVAAIRGADPAHFGDPTPCSDWTVGQAVNHLAFGLVMAEYGARKEAWPPDWTEDERCPYLRGVPEAEWADRAAEAGRRGGPRLAGPGGVGRRCAVRRRVDARRRDRVDDDRRSSCCTGGTSRGRPARSSPCPSRSRRPCSPAWRPSRAWAATAGGSAPEVPVPERRPHAGPRARPVRPRPGPGARSTHRTGPAGRALLGERAHALLALLAREEPGGQGEHLGELVGQSRPGARRAASPSSPRAPRARRAAACRRSAPPRRRAPRRAPPR